MAQWICIYCIYFIYIFLHDLVKIRNLFWLLESLKDTKHFPFSPCLFPVKGNFLICDTGLTPTLFPASCWGTCPCHPVGCPHPDEPGRCKAWQKSRMGSLQHRPLRPLLGSHMHTSENSWGSGITWEEKQKRKYSLTKQYVIVLCMDIILSNRCSLFRKMLFRKKQLLQNTTAPLWLESVPNKLFLCRLRDFVKVKGSKEIV